MTKKRMRTSMAMREWLRKNKTTLKEISRKCGYGPNYASTVARGRLMPPADKLMKMAGVMGVTIDDAYYLFIDSRH